MGGGYGAFEENPAESISLIPYIRRLVVTGFDKEEIIEAFFGPDYKQGVNSFWEIERRNYLFAAKSANWLRVKASYEPSPEETIPYMMPLMRVTEEEVMAAERKWSEWLALQDWMVGPRMPGEDVLRRNGNGNGNSYAMRSPGQRIKMEEDL